MKEERITNPQSVDRREIEEKIAAGCHVILQFDGPCYNPDILKKINNLCGEWGENLHVRFYGFYKTKFDASCLQFLPEVAALSIDCLREAVNLSTLNELGNLRRLLIGIYKLDCPDFLKFLRLENLEGLTLSETAKSNFDLAPLQTCHKLEELGLVGHTKNINGITRLPALRTLFLSRISKRQNLGFVSGIKNLKKLTLILGGRENIDEIKHPALEQLEIIRVMGFSNFESLGTFPSLRSLKIEDQIRVEKIIFTASNKNLESLRISNCKNLHNLVGLNYLTKLNEIFIFETMLNVDSIIQQQLPPSLKIFRFFTGKIKEDKEVRKKLDALGYLER
jgi:hypothetical protein